MEVVYWNGMMFFVLVILIIVLIMEIVNYNSLNKLKTENVALYSDYYLNGYKGYPGYGYGYGYGYGGRNCRNRYSRSRSRSNRPPIPK